MTTHAARTYLDWNASAPLCPEARAAMIAALSDLTIPVVSRLSLRDLAVIEGWLAPFVDDTK